MAYNYFPAGYQPAQIYYPSQPNNFPTQQNANPTQNAGLIWIQGEAAAKSYLVAPGNTVALWDSEAQVVYLKSADASGMPSMRVLDYTIRDDAARPPANTPKTDYATKDDITSVQKQIDEIRANMPRRKGGRNEPTVSDDGQ